MFLLRQNKADIGKIAKDIRDQSIAFVIFVASCESIIWVADNKNLGFWWGAISARERMQPWQFSGYVGFHNNCNLTSKRHLQSMKHSRYLNAGQFLEALSALRLRASKVSAKELEYLEKRRILVPHTRIIYPAAVERRWLSENSNYGWVPNGVLERDTQRWRAAYNLEKALYDGASRGIFGDDPLQVPFPLDAPKPEWRSFITDPRQTKFRHWRLYRTRVDCDDGPDWQPKSVRVYYSSWQLLQFLESGAGGSNYTLAKFKEHESTLNAVTHYADEYDNNYLFVIGLDSRRRLLTGEQSEEIERRSKAVTDACRSKFNVTYQSLIALAKFLAYRWSEWDYLGRPILTEAYKSVLSQTIILARKLQDVEFDKVVEDVGRVSGNFKPTLRIIYRNWASEWRESAEGLFSSFSSPAALLRADFSMEQVNAFLAFVEANGLEGFYWHWRAFNERIFSVDPNRLVVMRSYLQGMALSAEHFAGALLVGHVTHIKLQLYDKFKQIWPSNSEVGKLLKNNEYQKIAHQKGVIDLDWFESKQGLGEAVEIASDLAICHAIRGNAHQQISETNQLRLERMSLILLRGVMRAYIATTERWP
jgi:hypothetical protein